MKIVYNTWFPFGNYHTLNFFGILFTKRKQLLESTITHESIHTAQMKEMLWLFFYLWYGVEYLSSGCSTRNRTVHITISVLRKRLTIMMRTLTILRLVNTMRGGNT